jgi:hypothetical protein
MGNYDKLNGMFGCEKKMRREKKVRESLRREKDVRNRVDLICCLE